MADTNDMQAAAPDQSQERIAPVTESGNRIASLDFIRGIAVMGILLANIAAFGQPFTAYMWPEGFLVADRDPGGWQWIAQFVAVDGKMRGLFSLLFGAGMVLFMDKAWARGHSRWLQLRRLGWLLVFGMLHFFLLWRGDILVLYSLCGAVALLTLRWKPGTQIVAALVAYVIGSLFWISSFGFLYLAAETSFGDKPGIEQQIDGVMAAKTGPMKDAAVETAILQGGSYADLVAHKLSDHALDWIGTFTLVGWETIPLMLLGMALFRLGLFDGRMNPAKMRLWGWIGVIGGSALTLTIALWVKAAGFTYFSTMFALVGVSMLPRLPVILGLAALLALYGAHASGWLTARISAAGRMAFSNYLGTSVVLLFVFSPWALDLFGKLGRPELYLVVLAVWALMLLWSKPWLERFRYGPLEWLWRCLTYGKLFALRR